MINVAVFASGSGTNAENLVKTFNSGSRIRVALCLTDKADAPVMAKMEALGVPTAYYPRNVWREEPQVILDVLEQNNIDIVVLAGFLCFVDDSIVKAYKNRMLNIHPSLLPAYGGKGMHGARLHQAVIDAKELKSGATVHYVTEEVDGGPIILQKEVPVMPDDTPETLAARVHEVEYEIYPQAVMQVAASLEAKPTASTEDSSDVDTAAAAEPERSVEEPPAIPKSVDDAWADALGVANNVPPVPENHERHTDSQTWNSAPQGNQSTPYGGQGNNVYARNLSNSPYAQNMQGTANGEPMPPTWLAWSVVMTILCCFVPGVVAIFQSAKVSSKYYAGDIEGAKRASRNAEIWIIISFVLGVISNTLYIPLTIAGLL